MMPWCQFIDWINNHHTGNPPPKPVGWRTKLGHRSEVSIFTRAMALVATGIICAAIAYVSYTAWALTGFGSAIIFQILWYFISLFYGSGDIVDGLLYLSIAGVAVMPYQAVLLRKHINWKLVGVMLIGFIPFLFVARILVACWQVLLWCFFYLLP